MNNYMNIYYMNMVDNAQSNWIVVRKIYGDDAPSIPLQGR